MIAVRIAALLGFYGIVPVGPVRSQRNQLAAVIGTMRF